MIISKPYRKVATSDNADGDCGCSYVYPASQKTFMLFLVHTVYNDEVNPRSFQTTGWTPSIAYSSLSNALYILYT